MTHEQALTSGYTISDDLARFDLALGHRWISRESYWSEGIPLEVFKRSVAGSLTVGAYAAEGPMVGMLRVVTDRATFGWVDDVFVDRASRGHGLGKALIAYVRSHPDLQTLGRFALATRDAQGLYAQFGFGPLGAPHLWMEIRNRDAWRVPTSPP